MKKNFQYEQNLNYLGNLHQENNDNKKGDMMNDPDGKI